ncbi:helix-turn-helix transcriptional regulator [Cryomorpha ignava]|uniref:Helix-turn-helix transcriptional regulator n=1 Tax=Cryomorpha ignava TaxID=101383 RepID=A0A7K3WVM5_9FLAO|nr:helix-turn-helix transcriptional regulator [Cryomorpha ignava]NEN25759.1 helix-turn-helix transcriptional regulator [Cryomorpha ignava]
MELKDRIATIIKVNNHTASSFADLLGIQRSSVSHILNGRNNPSLDFIQKVLENFPRVDSGWLITGKNPESKKPDDTPTINKAPHEITTQQPKMKSKSKSEIKTIEKIVIFYTDRTFETYEQD